MALKRALLPKSGRTAPCKVQTMCAEQEPKKNGTLAECTVVSRTPYLMFLDQKSLN